MTHLRRLHYRLESMCSSTRLWLSLLGYCCTYPISVCHHFVSSLCMGMSTNHDLFRVASILIVDRFRQITSPLSKCNHGGLIIPLRTRAISPHRMSYRRCLGQWNIAKRYISRHGALIWRRPLWAMRSQSIILSSLAQKPDATVILVSRVPIFFRILTIFGVEQKALFTFSMSKVWQPA
ncbi:hypothetical protein ASPTUDRAFT_673383 [Aspergillus tubingensis CBS 134.48]|uniref:Uncharacterized protein n=1 Tax=Aspergillus tubingensis (strain CBS 134.48) TaxID=767770 RepID=A0A1L9N082_ASPTC|nr:hypothetical protein ASPTUDRAFT_673383 [Aspergillus tubingensis CBS 134.48]